MVKGPSEMKNDPIVMAEAAANLKNQNLQERIIAIIINILILKIWVD